MLLNRLLPECDFSEEHSVWVPCGPGEARAALCDLRVAEVRVLGPLMALRAWPARLLGRRAAGSVDPGKPVLKLMAQIGSSMRAAGSGELVVYGAGRPWLPAPQAAAMTALPFERFARFSEPGYAKIAANFTFTPQAGGTRVATVTRVACTSLGARLCFAPYWALIRLPSGLIRRGILSALAGRLADRSWLR